MLRFTFIIISLSFLTNLFGQTNDITTVSYFNGAKMLEKLDFLTACNNNSKIKCWKTRYINMWQNDGKQILKNGNGVFYQNEPPVEGLLEGDSLVYVIKDSVKNGEFYRYRLYRNSKYFIVETGQYRNDKEFGIFRFRDSIKLTSSESHFINDLEITDSKYYYPNYKIKKEGQTINYSYEGLWRFYSEQGNLIKEVNYKNGTEFGSYKEYQNNGEILVIGQYKHIEKIVEDNCFDASGLEMKCRTRKKNIPKKTGVWKYYDINGKLLKTIVYKK